MGISQRVRAAIAAAAVGGLLAGCLIGGIGTALFDRMAWRPAAAPAAGDPAAARDDEPPPAEARPRVFKNADAARRHAIENGAR